MQKKSHRLKYLFPAFIQRCAWFPLRVVFRLLYSFEVKGVEHVRNVKKTTIFASNHVSELDPLLIVSALPFFSRHLPLIYVANQSYSYLSSGWKKVLYGGATFKLIGAYPAQKGLYDYNRALSHHIHSLKSGRNVCVFPEGKRVVASEKVKAKGGVSYLATHTKHPVIPLRIHGVSVKKDGLFPLKRKRITVTFGKPFYPEDFLFTKQKATYINYEKAAAVIMQRVYELS